LINLSGRVFSLAEFPRGLEKPRAENLKAALLSGR
jgi:hypothetical protein